MLHVPIGSKEKYEVANYWDDFLNIVEDLPTGIVSIDNSQSTIDNDVWFTLNGVRLNGKPTKAGIYIVNGKKVVIKWVQNENDFSTLPNVNDFDEINVVIKWVQSENELPLQCSECAVSLELNADKNYRIDYLKCEL